MYYSIDDVSQNTAFDSITKTVLLSYYCQSSVFQRNTKMVLPFKLLFPMYYLHNCFRCIFKLTSVCQNSVSGSNTKTVLLPEAVLFKDPVLSNEYFRNGFSMYYWLHDVSQHTAFDGNTKTVLLSQQCFSKKYKNGITF